MVRGLSVGLYLFVLIHLFYYQYVILTTLITSMTNEDFIKLQQETEKKISFDSTNITSKISEVPKLHSTYLRILLEEKKELDKLENTLNRVYATKYEYYKFNHTYRYDTKTEIESQINADNVYIANKERYTTQQKVVDYLDGVLGIIRSLSFQHKNYIEIQKFLNGG